MSDIGDCGSIRVGWQKFLYIIENLEEAAELNPKVETSSPLTVLGAEYLPSTSGPNAENT